MRNRLLMLLVSSVFASTLQAEKADGVDVVKGFFNAFDKGDMAGLIGSFHEKATINAVREGKRKPGEPYGTYKGKKGVEEFIQSLGAAFNTKEFTVENVIGSGDVVFANGRFKHELKSTGKTYESAWALKCVIKDGKILTYDFYEDTAGFIEANR